MSDNQRKHAIVSVLESETDKAAADSAAEGYRETRPASDIMVVPMSTLQGSPYLLIQLEGGSIEGLHSDRRVRVATINYDFEEPRLEHPSVDDAGKNAMQLISEGLPGNGRQHSFRVGDYSTSHIRPSDVDVLEAMDWVIADGHAFWVETGQEGVRELGEDTGASGELAALLSHAQSEGYRYAHIDQDGPVHPDLDVVHW